MLSRRPTTRAFSGKPGILSAIALLLVSSAGVAGAKDIETDDVTISAGTREGKARFTPWSGVWWSFADCELAKGWNGTGDDFTYDSATKKHKLANPQKPVNDRSPLLKYDEYVRKATGTDPRAAWLEVDGDPSKNFMHHVYGDIQAQYDRDGISYGWWGHCNGWCAAALMEREPVAPIEAQGVRFEVADLKGLLTSCFWSVQSDFTGRRYNLPPANLTDSRQPGKDLLAKLVAGTPAPVGSYVAWYEKAYSTTMSAAAKAAAKVADFKPRLEKFEQYMVDNYDLAYKDVNPDVWHKILETVIGRKKLAFVADITCNEEVWNHPAYAYSSVITFKRDFTENGVARKEWSVETTVSFATDGVSESIIGISSFDEHYTYTLVTDTAGKLLRGEWTGSSVDSHPDFAWLPTFNPAGPDSGENWKVEYGKVQGILPTLHATSQPRAFDLTANTVRASDRRASDQTTTWSQPVVVLPATDVALTIAFTSSQTGAQAIAKVAYFEQKVDDGYDGITATRDALVPLGESTTAPAFSVTARFAASGKKMLVAYGYNSAGRLVGIDELALQVGSGNNTGGGGNNLVDDAFEPNDTKAAATPVLAGTTPNLVCKNDDWFAVTLTQAADLEVKIDFKHAEGDLDLVLEGPSGQLGTSDSTNDQELVSKTALAAGVYHVHVLGYNGARAMYSLTVTIKPTAGPVTSSDDRFEENDTKATAAAIGAGVQTGLQCRDDDWFKVTVGAAGKLEARIDFKHSEGDLDLELWGAGTAALKKSESTSDRETVSANGLPAGTYWIHVLGYRGAKAAYTLTVTQ